MRWDVQLDDGIPHGELQPKRPKEVCKHPWDHRVIEEGKTLGEVVICLDCGRILNDPDEEKVTL